MREASNVASEHEVRISDRDRNEVIDQLRAFTGDGRLTLDEFEERVEVVLTARTRSELAPALADLPPVPLSIDERPPPPAPQHPAGDTRPPDKARWIVSVMGGSDRKGRWHISRRTNVVAVMGGAALDLRQAVFESSVVDITCVAVMGGVDVIVPEGVPVDFDGFVLMGGRDERLADVPTLPGAPLVRVRAYGLWGGVTVKSKPPPGTRKPRSRGRGRSRSHSPDDPPPRSFTHDVPPHPPPPLPLTPGTPPLVHLPPNDLSIPVPVIPPFGRPQQGRADPRAESEPPEPSRASVGTNGATNNGDHGHEFGTLTILATDIVGSTSLAERMGDQRWLTVLQAHNAAVREQISRHHGTEIKQSGDGFIATFRSSRDAVRTAVAIRRSVGSLDEPSLETPLTLRIGVHAGELEHDGADVYGVNVSTACRIAGAAAPGEILVSGVVRELADSTSDLTFGESREVVLAGRSYPLRVHAAYG